MTKLLTILAFAFSFTASAQDSLSSFSYYFKTKDCAIGKNVMNINDNQFGAYNVIAKNKFDMRANAGYTIKIDELGLYIERNRILSISREEVRENSKYMVRNGYLHGITPTDSFAVAIEDETYYFLMPTKTFLYDVSSTSNSLFKINETTYYVFTTEDNGYYSVMRININETGLKLAELDLSYTQVENIKHTLTSENEIKTYLLIPSKKQWDIIKKGFLMYDSFEKDQ